MAYLHFPNDQLLSFHILFYVPSNEQSDSLLNSKKLIYILSMIVIPSLHDDDDV
jgi:hypothetical protein